MGIQDNPTVTVVTVTYNEEKNLATTIESIIQQSYRSKEYIIVDGNSSDRTPEIISSYSDHIDKLICEPDDGVYDAMNKAIDLASGEWIIFINAGDIFCDSEVLSKVFQHEIGDEIDFIYGDYIWKGSAGTTIIKSRPLELMWQKICFSHQSLFTRTQVMKQRKFDTDFMIVSDYAFYFSAYMDGHKFFQVHFPISIFQAGGLSDVHFLKRTIERWRVVRRYRNDFGFHIFYGKLIMSHYWNTIKRYGKSKR